MARSDQWQIGARVAGIMVPVILALTGVIWLMTEAKLEGLEERMTRQEARHNLALERIENHLSRIEERVFRSK